MKPLLLFLLFFTLCASSVAAKVKIESRGNFIRIEDHQKGQPYILYLNRSAVLSTTMVKVDRSFTVEIVTKELVASGHAAVNKIYAFHFFSEAEAVFLMDSIASIANTP